MAAVADEWIDRAAEAWIDLLLKRAPDLRRAGILSLGCHGLSAVLAPPEPAPPSKDDDKDAAVGVDAETESANLWENRASYPTGEVPTIGAVDPPDKLPPIPDFGDT